MSKRKDKLVMPPIKHVKKTTKTPDGEAHLKLTHQEVNWGNVPQLFLAMLSNMNRSLTDIARDVEEIKKHVKSS